MDSNRISQIRQLLEKAGLTWMFESEDAEARAEGLAAEFEEAQNAYNDRYNSKIDFLEVTNLHLEKYQPFLQSIGLPMSPQMRMVILRLIEGCQIQDMQLNYSKGHIPEWRIKLSGEDEAIVAPSPWDVLLLPQLTYFVTDQGVEIGPVKPWMFPGEQEEN